MLGESLAVRQNIGAESSRNKNESTVCVGFAGLENFALRTGQNRLLAAVLFFLSAYRLLRGC